MQINSRLLHPLKHHIYTWKFTYINFQSNKFDKRTLHDKWFSQKAAECVIMNITSFDCFMCCCSDVHDYEWRKKKERKKRKKKTYQYIWQQTANLQQKQLCIILLLHNHLIENGLQDFSTSYCRHMYKYSETAINCFWGKWK